MRGTLALVILACPVVLSLNSCTQGEPEKKPVGPPGSEVSKIPWNTPISGQGQGQFGMMEQNKYRR
jgi:hypothetical protein